MKRLIVAKWIVLVFSQLLLITTCIVADTENTSQSFDDNAVDPIETVSTVRHLLRSACKRVMAMPAEEGIDTALLDSAIHETYTAGKAWEKALMSWGGIIPGEYKMHPAWDSATEAIKNGINDMLEKEQNSFPDSAFLACRHVAFQFVTLNQQAGVHLTCDVLFRFKATAKQIAASIKSGDYDAVRRKLPELTRFRNEALVSPTGGKGTIQEKKNSLQEFTIAFDKFTKKLNSGSKEQITGAYNHLFKAVDRAFEAYL